MHSLKILSAKQWLKNSLILIPGIFAAITWTGEIIINLIVAIIGFSLVTSAVYIQNDLKDRQADQQHPEKKHRAIASEIVSTHEARIIQMIVGIVGMTALFYISPIVGTLGATYIIINFLYSGFLKQIPIIDLLCILSGYFIRLMIGQEIANAHLSIWILIMVGILAVYLVLMKRYGDVIIYKELGIEHRETVVFYSKLPIKAITTVLIHLAGIFFGCYILVVFSTYPETFTYLPYLALPFAYGAIVIYHQKALNQAEKDPITVLTKSFWSLSFLLISFLILIITLYPVA